MTLENENEFDPSDLKVEYRYSALVAILRHLNEIAKGKCVNVEAFSELLTVRGGGGIRIFLGLGPGFLPL